MWFWRVSRPTFLPPFLLFFSSSPSRCVTSLTPAAPNLLGTFFKHYLTPGKNREDAEGKDTARVQLMYDQGELTVVYWS